MNNYMNKISPEDYIPDENQEININNTLKNEQE